MLELDKIKGCFNNKAIDWIIDRIKQPNYRGQHLVQHYRYSFDDITKILNILNKYAPNKKLLRIRTIDLSKQPIDSLEWKDYSLFCQELKEVINNGTQDSIRKILFVDLERLGLINRYDKNKILNLSYTKNKNFYVSLSDDGLKLINCKDPLKKEFLIGKCVNNFLKGIVNTLINILREVDKINIYEYTFFISAIDFESNFILTEQEAIFYIKEYRKLSKAQQKGFVKNLKDIMIKKDNQIKRYNTKDFHNWINESRSLFNNFLKNVVYFNSCNEELYLSNKNGLFTNNKKRLDRNIQAKIDYFKNHNIEKEDGFELHHIIPLAWSTSPEHFKMLDNWLNLIYIDAYSHRKIRQNIILEKTDNNEDLKLLDYQNNEILFKKNINILYNYNNQKKMLDKNKELIENNT